MNPTIVRPPSIIAIVARAPHPYASALFLDYHLSKEASEIMVKSQGRWSPRKDVPWTVEPQGDLHVVSALQWGPKMRKLVQGIQKGRFTYASNLVQMNHQGSFLRKKIAELGYFSRSADDAVYCSSR